ncbi:hypothetical protein JTB14_023023 [Gonioctena quinquepunctata]|nr:hypothetical protein JTB14_023023 [Gonioctena quinquepunctata]
MTEQEHTSVENEQATDPTTTTIISQPVIQRKRKSDTFDKSTIDFSEAKKLKVSQPILEDNFWKAYFQRSTRCPETTFRQFKRKVFELIDTLSNPSSPYSLHSGSTSLHHSNSPSVSSTYIPSPSNSPYLPYPLHAESSFLHHPNPPSVSSSHIPTPEPNLYDLTPVSTASLAHISYTFSP